jgi:L-lactate dehydrogenase complex protein LldG
MNSRSQILATIQENKPEFIPFPQVPAFKFDAKYVVEQFCEIANRVGSKVITVSGYEEIEQFIKETYQEKQRIVSEIPELSQTTNTDFSQAVTPHSFHDVDLAIIKAHFGVAENGAVWVSEELMGQRVIPFITQHLAIILNAKDVVATMHQAYEQLADTQYGYGCFIAGPSKTADIEQSLVIGAHGARSLTVFLLGEGVKGTSKRK